MKIKIRQSIAGMRFSYRPGEIADIDVAEARRWCNGGIAEPAEPWPKEEPPASDEDGDEADDGQADDEEGDAGQPDRETASVDPQATRGAETATQPAAKPKGRKGK